jgi:anti-sigma factor RsiW
MNCDLEMMALLAGSAAGTLEAEEERRVREHVQGCAACAAHLGELAELAASFAALPFPAPPPDLAERTRWLLEAEQARRADRRQAAVLAALAGVSGWVLTLSGLYLWRLFSSGVEWVWLAWYALPPMVAVPAAAAIRRSRLQRSEV